MAERVKVAALVVGRRYRIEIDDCCVRGDIRGTYLGLAEGEDPEDDYMPRTHWSFGDLELSGDFYAD